MNTFSGNPSNTDPGQHPRTDADREAAAKSAATGGVAELGWGALDGPGAAIDIARTQVVLDEAGVAARGLLAGTHRSND